MGSTALHSVYVAAGRADATFGMGTNPWDIAAWRPADPAGRRALPVRAATRSRPSSPGSRRTTPRADAELDLERSVLGEVVGATCSALRRPRHRFEMTGLLSASSGPGHLPARRRRGDPTVLAAARPAALWSRAGRLDGPRHVRPGALSCHDHGPPPSAERAAREGSSPPSPAAAGILTATSGRSPRAPRRPRPLTQPQPGAWPLHSHSGAWPLAPQPRPCPRERRYPLTLA